jgi:catechol 2,3-dioxygenase-like lactoylglutathione lyase family enzyme
MSVHHIAMATNDLQTTHHFYTEAMGFELAKVVVGPTPEGGWAKHAFYETADAFGGGPGMVAFWELHGDYPDVDGALSTSVGLPTWVNHLAFTAVDEAHLDAALKRWLDLGLEVAAVHHGFCRSIYTNDPNGTAVEWCMDTRPLNADDAAHAKRVILEPAPDWDDPPEGFNAYPADPDKQPDWMS